jgi:hypothetical protein
MSLFSDLPHDLRQPTHPESGSGRLRGYVGGRDDFATFLVVESASVCRLPNNPLSVPSEATRSPPNRRRTPPEPPFAHLFASLSAAFGASLDPQSKRFANLRGTYSAQSVAILGRISGLLLLYAIISVACSSLAAVSSAVCSSQSTSFWLSSCPRAPLLDPYPLTPSGHE